MDSNVQIQLAEYDAAWPALFTHEAARIRGALGARAIQIEHVGSTAVPGLAAKPVIDIVVAVADSADEPDYAPLLQGSGYRLCFREPDWHEHRLFNAPKGGVNVHVFSFGAHEIKRMLMFRDRLRRVAEDRDRYAQVKRALVQRRWPSVQDYADAKSEIVREILARALGEQLQILTPRLRLRPLELDDIPEFIAYRGEPEVARYQGWQTPYTAEQANALLKAQESIRLGAPGQWLQVAVIDRAGGQLCGDCAVRVLEDWRRTTELGVTLAPSWQGRGIAREALGALIDEMIAALELHRVVAHVDERNRGARRLFERLGFRQEARYVEADWFKGSWSTLLLYAMLSSEWRAVPESYLKA